MVWRGMVGCGVVWHGMAWHGVVWCGYGVVWYGVVWHGVVWGKGLQKDGRKGIGLKMRGRVKEKVRAKGTWRKEARK